MKKKKKKKKKRFDNFIEKKFKKSIQINRLYV